MTASAHSELIDAILAYLASHPQAADSVDGVARWWLQREGASPSRDSVEQALALMVARGLLRRVELPDGTVLYGREGAPRH